MSLQKHILVGGCFTQGTALLSVFFWSLCCLSFCDLLHLITSSIYYIWWPLLFTPSDDLFYLLHLMTSSIYSIWLPPLFTTSDYLLYFLHLITPLVSSNFSKLILTLFIFYVICSRMCLYILLWLGTDVYHTWSIDVIKW